jgi:hypothetical protein
MLLRLQIELEKALARIKELEAELKAYESNPSLNIVIASNAPLEKKIKELEEELQIWRPNDNTIKKVG